VPRVVALVPSQPNGFHATMAKEIERKFLVEGDAWREAASSRYSLVQFYLAAAGDRSIRIRIRDGKAAMLTLKFGARTCERDEFEYEIPLSDAAEMRAFAVGTAIEKTRHLVEHDGHLFEVDEFHGALEGLVMAELETPEAAKIVAFPGWIGEEVTDDPGYANATLAIAGRPKRR
jgi:CYTH domain-containing protein